MLSRPVELPIAALDKLGAKLAVPFALVTVGALVLLFRVGLDPRVYLSLPQDDSYVHTKERLAAHFTPSLFTLVSLDLSREQTGVSLAQLSEQLAGLEGVYSVVSPTTIRDVVVDADELRFAPLTAKQDPSFGELASLIRQTSLFEKLLMSRDDSAINVYVFHARAERETRVVAQILAVLDELRVDAQVFGDLVLRYRIERHIVRDFVLLCTLAVLVVLGLELLITRRIVTALVLLVCSLLPAVWVVSLFPLLGIELDVTTILVPVVVLALATSYGIHLLRHYSLAQRPTMAGSLRAVTPVIGTAAATTLVGFGSLLFSRVKELRTLGLFLMIGILFALLCALFLLPAILCRCPLKTASNARRVQAMAGGLRTPRFVMSVIGVSCVAVMAGLGLPLVRYDYRVSAFFWPTSETARSLEYFYDRYGGLQELELIIDTGREHGLVDVDTFDRIHRLSTQIATIENVSVVISPTDFVQWFDSRMRGESPAEVALTSEAIGEALELLSGVEGGLSMRSLVDISYRRIKILIRFGIPEADARPVRVVESLLDSVDAVVTALLPKAHYDVLGIPVEDTRRIVYITNGQRNAVVFFVPLLVVVLVILLRSVKWALVTVAPTCLGILVYYGLMGWLRIPLTAPTAVSLALVMGVSVDDVLYFTLFFRQELQANGPLQAAASALRKAGGGIVQTTLIIDCGLGVLVFSTIIAVTHSGLLAALTLAFCTMVTLLLVPRLLFGFARLHQRRPHL